MVDRKINIAVEIYFGYYLGDHRVWDTIYLFTSEVYAGTDIDISSIGMDVLEKDMLKYFDNDITMSLDEEVAFRGVYSINEVENDDN